MLHILQHLPGFLILKVVVVVHNYDDDVQDNHLLQFYYPEISASKIYCFFSLFLQFSLRYRRINVISLKSKSKWDHRRLNYPEVQSLWLYYQSPSHEWATIWRFWPTIWLHSLLVFNRRLSVPFLFRESHIQAGLVKPSITLRPNLTPISFATIITAVFFLNGPYCYIYSIWHHRVCCFIFLKW